jgi:Uma2 family endonuclease
MRERVEMPVGQRLVTAEEFERMPEEPGVRTELVRGRVVRVSPPGFRHGLVQGRLYELLAAYARSTGAGRVIFPVGFKLASNPDTVREPDLAFLIRSGVTEPDGFFPGPPDLAIEVVSPTDRRAHLEVKIAQYLETGVRMVWVVDPTRETVTVHAPDAPPISLSGDEVSFNRVAGTSLPPAVARPLPIMPSRMPPDARVEELLQTIPRKRAAEGHRQDVARRGGSGLHVGTGQHGQIAAPQPLARADAEDAGGAASGRRHEGARIAGIEQQPRAVRREAVGQNLT